MLTYTELEQVRKAIDLRVESCSLHEFETELDFTSKIGYDFTTISYSVFVSDTFFYTAHTSREVEKMKVTS